ncbi:tail fiber assembly protein [Pseudomonas sp. PNPG3]|uniref:tail fiber assembly protein n=1 Tax=Pseudomonas sp. PNPG3 TaxID=2919497 RepID=UPI001FFC2E22|nr:tail fiber assembly protein [Pseudomonas sp. PNPG3]MCK2122108.1 tail fiber assembly protein [Pseudomonas sp. PNPG3]
MSVEQVTTQPEPKWWSEPGVVAPQVSNYSPYTREFKGVSVADPSPMEPGVWLIPGLSVIGVAPEASPGHVMVLDADGRTWYEVEDHRGKTVYSVETQDPFVWEALGAIPETHTLLAPEGQFKEWDGDEWVDDEAAKAAALAANAVYKQRLLTQLANENITRLNTAVRLDMATDAEIEALHDWEVYLVLLGRLSPSKALPTASDWPEPPIGDAAGAWLASMHFEEIEQPAAAVEILEPVESAISTESTEVLEITNSTKSTNRTAK